jgi:hypothetical protein
MMLQMFLAHKSVDFFLHVLLQHALHPGGLSISPNDPETPSGAVSSGGRSAYAATTSQGPICRSPLSQRSAVSELAVKSTPTKTFSGRFLRVHASKGAASRTPGVGTSEDSAERSATLPSSQRAAVMRASSFHGDGRRGVEVLVLMHATHVLLVAF